MTIQFKIQIRGVKMPPVWRRIKIPGDYTFHDLHETIQTTFGWNDVHLYQFEKSPYSGGWIVSKEDTNPYHTKVMDYIKQYQLDKFIYLYDFGDEWIHDITVEEINDKETITAPVCLAGKSSCPPEDCGGPAGYAQMKEEELDEEEIKYFDLEETNQILNSFEEFDKKHGTEEHDIEEEENDDLYSDEFNDEEDDEENYEEPLTKPVNIKDETPACEKDYLMDIAETVGLELPKKMKKTEMEKAYIQYVLSNPKKILMLLDAESLCILENVIKNPTPLHEQTLHDYEKDNILERYCLAEIRKTDLDTTLLYVAADFLNAVEPYVSEVMADNDWKLKARLENDIIGMANLYGIVSDKTICQLLEKMKLVEGNPQDVIDYVYQNSLALHEMDAESSLDEEGFVSPFIKDEIDLVMSQMEEYSQHTSDYRIFSEEDLSNAATPFKPIIRNDAEKKLVEFINKNTNFLTEYDREKAFYEIWFRHNMLPKRMYDMETLAESTFFFLLAHTKGTDKVIKEGIHLFADYLNNMPLWYLKGHTPLEVNSLVNNEDEIYQYKPFGKYENEEEAIDDLGFRSLFDDDEDDDDTNDYRPLFKPQKPYLAEKKPGRNDPCPCGSGKKYKNCCGKGN